MTNGYGVKKPTITIETVTNDSCLFGKHGCLSMLCYLESQLSRH